MSGKQNTAEWENSAASGIFKNKIINIGIDVHKRKCVATLKGQSSQLLQQITFYNNSDGIAGFIDNIKKYGDANAVCESTANYWIRLHDTLEEKIDTILAHPAKTTIAQAKLKNDRLDSEVLADLLRSDMICESFVADKQYRELRNLVRTRLGLIRTMYKNKIHSILAKYEYQSPAYKTPSKKGLKWLKEIELTDTDRMTMDAYLDGMQTTQKQIDTFESHMASISKDDQRIRLHMTIPGLFLSCLPVGQPSAQTYPEASPRSLSHIKFASESECIFPWLSET